MHAKYIPEQDMLFLLPGPPHAPIHTQPPKKNTHTHTPVLLSTRFTHRWIHTHQSKIIRQSQPLKPSRLFQKHTFSIGDIHLGLPPSRGHPSRRHPSRRHPSQEHPSRGHPSEGIHLGFPPSRGHPSRCNPSHGRPSQRHPSRGHPSNEVIKKYVIIFSGELN